MQQCAHAWAVKGLSLSRLPYYVLRVKHIVCEFVSGQLISHIWQLDGVLSRHPDNDVASLSSRTSMSAVSAAFSCDSRFLADRSTVAHGRMKLHHLHLHVCTWMSRVATVPRRQRLPLLRQTVPALMPGSCTKVRKHSCLSVRC